MPEMPERKTTPAITKDHERLSYDVCKITKTTSYDLMRPILVAARFCACSKTSLLLKSTARHSAIIYDCLRSPVTCLATS